MILELCKALLQILLIPLQTQKFSKDQHQLLRHKFSNQILNHQSNMVYANIVVQHIFNCV